MGNDSSTLIKRKDQKVKDRRIIMNNENGASIDPIYRKKCKRSISTTRYTERQISVDRKPSYKRKSSADQTNVVNDNLLAPTTDRQRSRSLCTAQMEKDAQTVAASVATTSSPIPIPKENARKQSNGLVPSLNRIRIQQSYKTAKQNIGESILRRAAATRSELRSLFGRLNEEQWNYMAKQMQQLIDDAVVNIDKAEEVREKAKTFGDSYAALCPLGFRPDFFSALADAAIAECVKLDNGVHKRCETLLAWSQLIAALFTSVRDGYYQRVRVQRRSSLPQHTITKQLSVDCSRDGRITAR